MRRTDSGWRSIVLEAVGILIFVLGGSGRALALPTPSHVVIVVEENHSYSQIIGNSAAPYINSLAQQGALFTDSFGVTHPSEPNYLALFSGSTQGITDDSCPHYFTTANLGREALNATLSFGGYSEDMPSVGYTGCTFNAYARKHNPWVDWQADVEASVNDIPAADNMPFTSFPTDYTTLPAISIVVPNLNDDMHDGTIQQGNSWLQSHFGPYVQWAANNNSLLIVTWDEDDGTSGNHIPTIFVGPMAKQGQYAETINHYNVLRTVEDLFGLGYAGSSANVSPVADCWTTSGGAVPSAPANLIAAAVSPSQINLNWTDNSSDETGFQILRSTDGTNFSQIATVGTNVTSYADTGLARRTWYYYKVRALNQFGVSADSNTASARTKRR